MYCIIVRFAIKAELIEDFIAMIRQNASESLKEPGCIQFDVCLSKEDPLQVVLYELYRDKESFMQHIKTSHFTSFDQETESMIEKKTVEELVMLLHQ